MARSVSSSGLSRRSKPRISAPICRVSGTTSIRLLAMTSMTHSFAGAVVGVSLGRESLAGNMAIGLGMRELGMLDLAARQGGKDFLHQETCRLRAQFHCYPFAAPLRLIDEIDAEGMIERRMERMVVIDVGGVDAHPSVRSLGAAHELRFLDDI